MLGIVRRGYPEIVQNRHPQRVGSGWQVGKRL